MDTKRVFAKDKTIRIGSYDQMDHAIHVVNTRHWMIWSVLAFILLSALLWGIFGEVSYKVVGKGILLPYPANIYQAISRGGRIGESCTCCSW